MAKYLDPDELELTATSIPIKPITESQAATIRGLVTALIKEDKLMKRINILLEESTYELLRKLSYEQHKPISKIIREMVEKELKK